MKPTAILLCGLPYAGKSAIADALISDGYFLISLNEINHQRGLGLDGRSVPGHEWLETHQIAMGRLASYISAGHNIVWDDSNYAAWIRDPIFEAAERAGADPVFVFVDTPVEVVTERAELAERARRHSRCPVEDFHRVVREFERPACGIRIDGMQPAEVAALSLRQALRREVLF